MPARSAAILAATVTTITLAGCAAVAPVPTEPTPSASAPSISAEPAPRTPVPDANASLESPSLAEDLRYLIEEEKLAHDVYTTLGAMWGDRIFENIARSEITHQVTVENLLKAYGVADPRSTRVGEFADPDLQALYDDLVASGSASRDAAIAAGILIEETDVADLQEMLVRASDDVAAVLERLLAGSTNHLEAFRRQA